MKRLGVVLAAALSLAWVGLAGAEDSPVYPETFSPYENALQWGARILRFEEWQDHLDAEARAQAEAKAAKQAKQAQIEHLEQRLGRKVKSWQVLNR